MPTLVNGFTYFVPAAQLWTGSPRRDPAVSVSNTLGAPSEAGLEAGEYPLEDNDDPLVGLNVELDLGEGVIFSGPINDTTIEVEGKHDQAKWSVHLTDFALYLNRIRPFACYTDVSATTAILDLMTRFTDGTFTVTGVEAGMPNITIELDGDTDFASALTAIMDQAGGRWRMDGRNLIARVTDETEQPDPIDENNTDLLLDQGIRCKDGPLSQVKNRIFGKGATAKVQGDVAAGAPMMYVDRIDIFPTDGALLFAGCNRFRYGSLRSTTIITPRDGGGNILASFLTTETGRVGSPFGAITLNYAMSLITDGEDTQIGPPSSVAPDSVGSGSNVTATGSVTGGQLTVGRTYQYAAGFEDAEGRITITAGGGGGTQQIVELGDNAIRLIFSSDESALNASRVPSITRFIVRRNLNDVGAPWSMVTRGLALGSGIVYIDGAADASLSAFDRWNFDSNGDPIQPGTEPGIDEIGRKIHLTFVIPADSTAKIWRKKSTDATYKLLTTINDFHVTSFIDQTPIDGVVSNTPPPDPNFPPVVLYGLYDIPTSGQYALAEALTTGTLVHLGVQRDDLEAQAFLAEREGGDGVHEDVFTDTSLDSVDKLNAACDKLLEKQAYPVKEVEYYTRDQKSKIGRRVDIDLIFAISADGIFDAQIFDGENDLFDNVLEKGIFGSFIIQETRTDQYHETTDGSLKPRLFVRASSGGRFTFQDFMNKVQVAP
jgi:hypothetical protein